MEERLDRIRKGGGGGKRRRSEEKDGGEVQPPHSNAAFQHLHRALSVVDAQLVRNVPPPCWTRAERLALVPPENDNIPKKTLRLPTPASRNKSQTEVGLPGREETGELDDLVEDFGREGADLCQCDGSVEPRRQL